MLHDNPDETQVPAGYAEILWAFTTFPSPLALVSREGALVLTNEAWTTKFGAASVVAESVLGVVPGATESCSVALRSAERGDLVEVRARTVRGPDTILLVIDEPGEPSRHAELEQLRGRVSQLEQLAATDHLTGAWNRAYFERLIAAELARSVESRQPVSLVLLGIDHFKHVNDTFGHSVGDSVLRELVKLVQARTRASDVLFRWGGEEFTLLAGSVGYRGAERLAENLRRVVAEHPFHGVGSVTISVGVAEHLGSEAASAWFTRLDQALDSATRGGRNRVVVDRRGNSDEWATDAGAATPHLVWREAYECGDPTIDREHREQFVIANQLIDAAFRGTTDDAVFRATLDELLEHVRRHFVDEEAILESHHYADLEQHKRAHAGLLRRTEYLKASAEAGTASLGSVVEFLAQDVVARHLMAVDRAFFPLFEKRAQR